MKLLVTFIILNILNVIIQTIKSIVTVKCGRDIAAITNAVAYGLYTVVTVYMMCDLPLSVKALVVALCNLVGVWVVKYFEEKARKDKLWLVKLTIPTKFLHSIHAALEDIPHSYIQLSEKYTVFDFYCATQADTAKVIQIAKQYNGKTFATENRLY